MLAKLATVHEYMGNTCYPKWQLFTSKVLTYVTQLGNNLSINSEMVDSLCFNPYFVQKGQKGAIIIGFPSDVFHNTIITKQRKRRDNKERKIEI